MAKNKSWLLPVIKENEKPKWSFGIVTHGDSPHLQSSLNSIVAHGPEGSEIIVVGGDKSPGRWEKNHLIWIPFNEEIKKGWLSKKKNLIAEVATNENLCIMHDYVALESGWIKGVRGFEDNWWRTCMHRVLNNNGDRYRGWDLIGNDAWHDYGDGKEPFFDTPGKTLSYNIDMTDEIARWFYMSGGYFCAKRCTMLEVPLDEDRVANQGEDVKWCRDLYFKYGKDSFCMNPNASVRFLKQKDPVPWQKLPPLS